MKILSWITTLTAIFLFGAINVQAQTNFVHTAKANNISGHITTINNSATNSKANALLFVTTKFGGLYNNNQAGVWYNGGKWKIYNENKKPLTANKSQYNVLVVKPSRNAFSHKATAQNISRNWTTINHPSCNNNPNAILFITQNWKGTYNPKAIGVWYNKGKWTIYNQDRTPMPKGTNFNVLVLKKGAATGIPKGKASIFTATTAAKKNPYGKHLSLTKIANDNAFILVSQNYGKKSIYNNHIPGVWYDGASKKWSIFNNDKTELPLNAQFNMLVINGKKTPRPVRPNPNTRVINTNFVHTAKANNINGHITTINNKATDSKANALLFVTTKFGGLYNNNQIGVWFSGGKWKIYNENKKPLTANKSQYNVLVVKPSKNAFSHKATTQNISNNWTTINHPSCNNNPNAVLFITQNWKGTYNPKAIGVWYNKGKWTIYNQDRTPMPKGTNFNVLVLKKGATNRIFNGKASIFTATAAAKKNAYGKHLSLTNITNKNAFILVSQNYGRRSVYNNHIPGVWYDGKSKKWSIFNNDKTELPLNAQYNMLVIDSKSREIIIKEKPVKPIEPKNPNVGGTEDH